jgi:hypothetical protein
MYSLGTWFVSGICVWIPYIKETMMIIIKYFLFFYLPINGGLSRWYLYAIKYSSQLVITL